jgi:hypothetical protein
MSARPFARKLRCESGDFSEIALKCCRKTRRRALESFFLAHLPLAPSLHGANGLAKPAMPARSATHLRPLGGIYPSAGGPPSAEQGDFMHRTIPTAIALIAAIANADAACTAHSNAERPHLVELYTSEGCNSCPPAERWMSTLLKHPDLIGLEFHVDYWDDGGWRDPYSNHAYTVRQKALAKRGNHDQIFTPQIWLDGHVWSNWPKGSPPEPVAGAPPVLHLTAESGDVVKLQLDADATEGKPDYRIYAALTENGLSEHVRAGENRGKTLDHDEVVRAFAGPFELPHAAAELKMPPHMDADKAAVVAFVQDEGDGSVVQAMRLPLAECKK